MHSQIKLGRIFGIEIGLHYSWLVIALLIVFSLAGHFREINPNWGDGVVLLTAVATGVLFFAAIIAHELAHSLVAKLRGLPVRSITLFALGGVSQIDKEAPDAKTEFFVAVVGPLTSFLIGIALLALSLAFGWSASGTPNTPLLAMLVWLGYINIVLAVFNLIPGYPLDGGRVLRAIVWWINKDMVRSTRIAARAGQAVALFFIFTGVYRLFAGAGFAGLWIAFIGWFLLDAAGASYAQVEVSERLRGVRVGDIMTRDCPTIEGRTNLQTFIDEFLLRTGRRCFIVAENGVVEGIITAHEIKGVEPQLRAFKTVSDVMRPMHQLRTVAADSPVIDVLETMGREDVNQLPVVSAGRLEGVISRDQVLRYLQTRIELRQ
ncbi:MAG TPA: site-2 protease family protein [Blastocatellia bacterium]|nr:site-2 protease family protein [Blastocatellia bacterium]